MKHKTAELEGALLDAAVAKAMRYKHVFLDVDLTACFVQFTADERNTDEATPFAPSTNPAQGQPIMERMRISLKAAESGGWFAYFDHPTERDATAAGPTSLIAVARIVVASVFGDEVELP